MKGGPTMPETPEPTTPSVAETQPRLHDVTRLLRQPGPIDPESQQVLAELVDELTRALETGNLPAAEVTHLAETTAHLAESLHHQQDLGLVGKARDRVERAVGNAE